MSASLIALNPQEEIPELYSAEMKDKISEWAKSDSQEQIPPHIWSISARSYRDFYKNNKKHSIVVSGERGAGKSHSINNAMSFIMQLMQKENTSDGLPTNMILLDNLIAVVETFGNAVTMKNDDSSRFAKYFELVVDQNTNVLQGTTMSIFLLEKSHITSIEKGERNFHIFYSICKSLDPEVLTKYKLDTEGNGSCDMTKFRYLNQSGKYDSNQIDDHKNYIRVNDAFEVCGFNLEEKEIVLKCISAVLNIGNIEIDKSVFVHGVKPCRIQQNEWYKNFMDLLQIDSKTFEKVLVSKEVTSGVVMVNNPDKIQEYLDTLAQKIYMHLFNWIVKKISMH